MEGVRTITIYQEDLLIMDISCNLLYYLFLCRCFAVTVLAGLLWILLFNILGMSKSDTNWLQKLHLPIIKCDLKFMYLCVFIVNVYT